MRAALRCALLLTGLFAAGVSAQDTRDLRASQLRLDSIRQERARLQREMDQLQTRVRDASREVSLLGRQRVASTSALQELELQASLLTERVAQTTERLQSTNAALDGRKGALRGRLRSIYKRGPLHSVRVLLSAENFGDLLNRYKYLHLVTVHDRTVIEEVSRLEYELRTQEDELGQTLAQLDNLRDEKSREVTQLQTLESRSRRALDQYRKQETSTARQLTEADKAEAALKDVMARLERERLEAERRRASAGGGATAGAITTRDLGALSWPVEGRVIYRFGPAPQPSGVTLINKGIGIAAAAGTPVKAVEAGEVVLARPFEGYGPTVMVSHGGGYYTLYMFLQAIRVQEGNSVTQGQVVGTVGGEQTNEGAHLYFQVHAPIRGKAPEAVDPLSWLRSLANRRP